MKSLAVAAVRAWTRLYTCRMPKALREERRAEIDSDLWEFQHDSDAAGGVHPAVQLLLRLILGIPDDLSWRLEQSAGRETPSRQTVLLMATAAGGVLFVAALSAIVFDITRERSASSSLMTSPGTLEAEIAEIMRGDAPESWKTLQAGILAVAVPVSGGVYSDLTLPAEKTASREPAFGGAWISENQSGDPQGSIRPPRSGLFIATNVTVRMLIRYAYQLPDTEISDGPHWLDADRFDIMATADGAPPPEQTRLMLRTLLAERFMLTVHTDLRDLGSRAGPVEVLVIDSAKKP